MTHKSKDKAPDGDREVEVYDIATILLRLENGAWVLQVRDDGSGFVPEPGKGGNIGLVGMRERAQNLGGRFSVTSASGQGTLIEIVIPAKQPQGEVQWKH